MDDTKAVDCPVRVDPQVQFGDYANAFRVLDGEGDDERVLEFLVYSEVEEVAVVVRRVRIHRALVPEMESMMSMVLELEEDLGFGVAPFDGTQLN
jgi:hypothetical protein